MSPAWPPTGGEDRGRARGDRRTFPLFLKTARRRGPPSRSVDFGGHAGVKSRLGEENRAGARGEVCEWHTGVAGARGLSESRKTVGYRPRTEQNNDFMESFAGVISSRWFPDSF